MQPTVFVAGRHTQHSRARLALSAETGGVLQRVEDGGVVIDVIQEDLDVGHGAQPALGRKQERPTGTLEQCSRFLGPQPLPPPAGGLSPSPSSRWTCGWEQKGSPTGQQAAAWVPGQSSHRASSAQHAWEVPPRAGGLLRDSARDRTEASAWLG